MREDQKTWIDTLLKMMHEWNYVWELMFNIIGVQENASKTYNEISLHIY